MTDRGQVKKRNLVLGPPYDGGYVWLLNKDLMRHDHGGQYDGSHPYYQTLYGPDHAEMAPRAASLSILYDDIFVAAADIGLPDRDSFMDGQDYYNPLIGTHHSWTEFHATRDALAELAEEDLQDPRIVELLPPDDWPRELMLDRINYVAMLSRRENAKLMVGPTARAILDIKASKAAQATQEPPLAFEDGKKVAILDKYFDFACFHFVAPHYDDLVALRQNEEVKAYATEFHQRMDTVVDDPDPYQSFVRLMASAQMNRSIAKQVQGGFATSGRICTWIGLIPIVGSAASAVGAGTDASGKTAELLANRQSWYLLGPKMSEVLLEERMSRPTK
jgi:hypothetical protein